MWSPCESVRNPSLRVSGFPPVTARTLEDSLPGIKLSPFQVVRSPLCPAVSWNPANPAQGPGEGEPWHLSVGSSAAHKSATENPEQSPVTGCRGCVCGRKPQLGLLHVGSLPPPGRERRHWRPERWLVDQHTGRGMRALWGAQDLAAERSKINYVTSSTP